MTRPPPRSPLFPYTTLFRSHGDLQAIRAGVVQLRRQQAALAFDVKIRMAEPRRVEHRNAEHLQPGVVIGDGLDRKSTRLNSSHLGISYAVFCLKKKNESIKMDPVRSSVRTVAAAGGLVVVPTGMRNTHPVHRMILAGVLVVDTVKPARAAIGAG